jgi:hypothetical protein
MLTDTARQDREAKIEIKTNQKAEAKAKKVEADAEAKAKKVEAEGKPLTEDFTGVKN